MRSRTRGRKKLFVERLENRSTPSAGFGFEVVGGDLYFQVTGSPYDDTITVKTVGADFSFECLWNDEGAPQSMSGTITAGDIALAELTTGADFVGLKVNGDAGSDFIDAVGITNAHTFLYGDAGHDKIIGGSQEDFISGGSGSDLLLGGRGNDTVYGDADADVLKGGGGSDVLYGGLGDDELQGDRGPDKLYGEEGSDYVLADNADTALSGGTGGEAGLYGDQLAFGSSTSGGVTVLNLDFETMTGTPYADVIDSTGFVGGGIFAGYGVSVDGTAGDDVLTGSAFADYIFGNADNDVIEGLAGADYLDGGAGVNTLVYAHSTAGVTVDLSTWSASGGHAAGDSIVNFQNLTGSEFGDILTGGNGDNVLIGLGGDDVMSGLMGNDIMDGGSGNDLLDGGIGNDRLTGGIGDDVVEGGMGDDTVVVNYSEGLNSDELYGGSGKDTFEFNGMFSWIDGVYQLDPAKVAAVEAYMDNLSDLGLTDWDGSIDFAFAYKA